MLAGVLALTKRCSSCGEVKPHEEFCRRAGAADGLQAYCRPCGRLKCREWYARNRDSERDRSRDRSRAAFARDPEGWRARNREWARRNPDKVRASNLRRYGLTPERFDEMLIAQGGQCAACSASEPGGQGTWHVDHDHACCSGAKRSCGRCVRALLCHRCNVTLGLVQDDRETLMALISYLDETRAFG